MSNTEFIKIFEEVTGKKGLRSSGDTAIAYCNKMPGLSHETHGAGDDEKWLVNRVKGTQLVTEDTLRPSLKLMDQKLDEGMDRDTAYQLAKWVIPGLIGLMGTTVKDNHPQGVALAFEAIVGQTYEKELKTITPLCPPYSYKVDSSGRLSHLSGELLPTVGPRYVESMRSILRAFKPLEEQGVSIHWLVATYAGDRTPEELVELGEDVTIHYKDQETMMLSRLSEAFSDLGRHSEALSAEKSTRTIQPVSIESEYAEEIMRFADDLLNYSNGMRETEKADEWCAQFLGVKDSGLIEYFIEQEGGYLQKQGVDNQHVVENGIKEAITYWYFAAQKTQGRIMIGLETTTNYMRGTLDHLIAPVIMKREFDHRKPESPLHLRQPFNIPKYV